MERLSNLTPEEIGLGSFSRHATPARNATEADPVSEQYPDITQGGIEQAQESARTDLLEMLDNAPSGAVMFIGAKSDQSRTGQTAEIYGDELKKISERRDDLFVVSKSDVEQIARDRATETSNNEMSDGFMPGQIIKTIRALKELVNNNPDKKIVIDYPLALKELGYAFEGRWMEDGKKTEYFDQILKKHDNSHAEAVHDWMEHDGTLTLDNGTVLEGPKPNDVARQYLHGLERVYKFVAGQLPGRPVMVHGTGHQWDLDAVATYLAKGNVTYQNFLEVMGRQNEDVERHPIGESEVMADITINSQAHTATVKYRGKEYITDLSPENEE